MKNFKRILALVLTLMFVVTSCASLSAVNNPTKWYMTAVNWIQDTGVDTIETADDKIDRDTFVTWVAKIESTFVDDSLWDDEVASTTFSDVTEKNHRAAIAYSAQRGFIVGNGDGTFAPDRVLTFAEACAVLVRAVGYDIYVTDKTGENWAYNYIMMATNRCHLVDATWVKNVGAYVPEHEMTKGEAAWLLYTAAGKTTGNAAVTVIYSSVIDNSKVVDTGKKLGQDLPNVSSTETVIIVNADCKAINADAKTSWNSSSFGTSSANGDANFAEQYFLTWGTAAWTDDAAGWLLKWTPSENTSAQVRALTAKQYAKTNYKTTSTYPISKNLDLTSDVLVQKLVNNAPTGATYTISAATVQKFIAKAAGLTETNGKLFKADGSAAYFFDYATEGTVLTITRKTADDSITSIVPASYYTVDTYRVFAETSNADLYNAGLANKFVASGASTVAVMNSKYDSTKDVTSWGTDAKKNPVLNFQGKTYNIVTEYTGKADDLMVLDFTKTDVTNASGEVEWHSINLANVSCFVPAGVTPYCFYLAADGIDYLTETEYDELVDYGTVNGQTIKTYALASFTAAEKAAINNTTAISSYYNKAVADMTAAQKAAYDVLSSRTFYKYHLFNYSVNGGASFAGAKAIDFTKATAQNRRALYLMEEVNLTADYVIFGPEKSTKDSGYTALTAAEAKAKLINAVEGEITTVYTDLDGDGAYDIAVINSVDPFEVCETLNVDDNTAINGAYYAFKGIPSYGSLFANKTVTAQSGINTDAFYLSTSNTGKLQLVFHESGKGGLANAGDGYYDYNSHTVLDYDSSNLIDVATMSTGYIKTVSTVATNGYYDAIVVTTVDGVATEVAVKIPAFGYVPTAQTLTYSAFGATTSTKFNSTAWMTFVTDYYDKVYEYYYENEGSYLYTINGTTDTVALTGKDAYAYVLVDGVATPVSKATYEELEAQTKLVTATDFDATIKYYYNTKGTATVPDVTAATNVSNYYRYYTKGLATYSDLATPGDFTSDEYTVADQDYYYNGSKTGYTKVSTWTDGVGYWFDNGSAYISYLDNFSSRTDMESPYAFTSQTDYYFNADGSAYTYFKRVATSTDTYNASTTYYLPVNEDAADAYIRIGETGMTEIEFNDADSFKADLEAGKDIYVKVTETSHKYASVSDFNSIDNKSNKWIKVATMTEITSAEEFAYLSLAKSGAATVVPSLYNVYYNANKTATATDAEVAADCSKYYRYEIAFGHYINDGKDVNYYYNADKTAYKTFTTIGEMAAIATLTDWYVGTPKTEGYKKVTIKIGTAAKGFAGQDSSLAIGDYKPEYYVVTSVNKGIESKTENAGTMVASYMTGKYIQYVLDAKSNVILAFDSVATTNTSATGFVVAVTKADDGTNTYTVKLSNNGIKSYNVRANASYLLDIANVSTYANIYSGNLTNAAYKNDVAITGDSFNYVKMTEDDGAYSVLTTIDKNQTWSDAGAKAILSSIKDESSGKAVQGQDYVEIYNEIVATDPVYVTKVDSKKKVTFDVEFTSVATRTKTITYTKVVESVSGGQYVPVVDSNGAAITVKANEATKYDTADKHYVAIDGKLYWEVVAGTYKYVDISKADAYTSETTYSAETADATLSGALSSYNKTVNKKSLSVLSAVAMKKTETGYIPGYYNVTFNGKTYTAAGSTKIVMMVPSSTEGKVVCNTTTIKEIVDNGAVLFATEAQVIATGSVLTGLTVIGEIVDQTVVVVTPTKPTEKIVYVSPDTYTVADIDETGTTYYVRTSKSAYAIDGSEFGPICYAYDTTSSKFIEGDIVTTIDAGAFYAVNADGTIKTKVATLYGGTQVYDKEENADLLISAGIADDIRYNTMYATLPGTDVQILNSTYVGSATITSIKDGKIVATVNGSKNVDITDWNVEFIYTDVDGKALYLAGDATNVTLNSYNAAVKSQLTAYKNVLIRTAINDTVKNSSAYSATVKAAAKAALTAANEALIAAKTTIATKYFNGQFWGTGLLTASPLGVYFNKVTTTFNKSATVSFNYVEQDGVYYVIVPTFVISAQ